MRRTRPTSNPSEAESAASISQSSTESRTNGPVRAEMGEIEDLAPPDEEHDVLPALASKPDALAGRYLLEGLLGGGFLATTYRGLDQHDGRPVAVKIFNEQASEHHQFRERLLYWVSQVTSLEHSGIVTIIDAGLDDGRLYLVTELVEGRTLRAILAEEGRLSVERAVTIGTQAADTLTYAHQRGIVHGDVRPENVFQGEHGQVKIADFGLTTLAVASGLLPLDALAERADYLSPEQVMGSRPSPRSDIYSLAVVLYEALAGGPPFAGSNLLAIASQRLVREPEPIRRARRDVPIEVDNAILRALTPNPIERYGSADEFRAALLERELALQLAPVPELPARVATRVASPGRSPVEQAVLLAPALATVAVGIMGFLFYTLLVPNVLSMFQFADAPDFTGRTLSESAQVAKLAGFDVTVESIQASQDRPKDTVITQVPAPGTRTSRATPIQLVVSAGIQTPDLRGMSLRDARAYLVKHDWKIGQVEAQAAQAVAPGSVVGQEPGPGELVHDKTEITLTVAGGNYAEGAETTASGGKNPGAAVDGNEQTAWTAGGRVPQWIEIDLKIPISVGMLELVPWQESNGPSIHEIWVTTQSGQYLPVHTFKGVTSDREKLSIRLDEAAQDVVRVKVHTALSPGEVGWREIRVLAGMVTPEDATDAPPDPNAPQGTSTRAAAEPTSRPQTVVVANTDGTGVFLRRSPDMDAKVRAWREGTKLQVRGQEREVNGVRWLPVTDPSGNEGWVPSQYVRPAGDRA